ncbi:MAG: hypothetical protein FJ010_02895 [Chloroflexi bacterium]|nr:hypothetical protein [Chloroflexota bacterium]
MNIDWAALCDGLIVFFFGVLVGMGELISRYRDDPWKTLISRPGVFYLGLNAIVSVAALVLIRGFGWTFDAQGDTVRWTQILVAGFGAMALFRSALFNVRVGDTDVSVGPNSFLQVVLGAADREVDRQRATVRADRAKEIMSGISFDESLVALPAFCIALMQNLPPEDQLELLEDVEKLASTKDIDLDMKPYFLGAALMNYVGEDVLRAAVKSLREHIEAEVRPVSPQ